MGKGVAVPRIYPRTLPSEGYHVASGTVYGYEWVTLEAPALRTCWRSSGDLPTPA